MTTRDSRAMPPKPNPRTSVMGWVVAIGFILIPVLAGAALGCWALWVAAPRWLFWVAVGVVGYIFLAGEEVVRTRKKHHLEVESDRPPIDPRWAAFALIASRRRRPWPGSDRA